MIDVARPVSVSSVSDSAEQALIARLHDELDTEGIVILPELLSREQLASMQEAFASRLRFRRWNNFEGFQQTEPQRQMVEDVLLLDQGFVDLALHPLVRAILNRYLGTTYSLTEAKGWKSNATKQDFHGWHGDAWYDQSQCGVQIPREVKLAFYLTDVVSGAFNFVKRSHRLQHPRMIRNNEIPYRDEEILELKLPAGSAFLFDTSGIHRQGVPMLEARCAVFYNYHDPSVPLQKEDLDYYRYHPLLLNAAFLGNLGCEDMRILGFGDKTNFISAFQRQYRPPIVYRVFEGVFAMQLRWENLRERASAKLKRMFGGSTVA